MNPDSYRYTPTNLPGLKSGNHMNKGEISSALNQGPEMEASVSRGCLGETFS